jgi:hypothetical protein
LKEKLKPSTKGKLKEFTTIKPALQKILEEILYTEEETRVRQEN